MLILRLAAFLVLALVPLGCNRTKTDLKIGCSSKTAEKLLTLWGGKLDPVASHEVRDVALTQSDAYEYGIAPNGFMFKNGNLVELITENNRVTRIFVSSENAPNYKHATRTEVSKVDSSIAKDSDPK